MKALGFAMIATRANAAARNPKRQRHALQKRTADSGNGSGRPEAIVELAILVAKATAKTLSDRAGPTGVCDCMNLLILTLLFDMAAVCAYLGGTVVAEPHRFARRRIDPYSVDQPPVSVLETALRRRAGALRATCCRLLDQDYPESAGVLRRPQPRRRRPGAIARRALVAERPDRRHRTSSSDSRVSGSRNLEGRQSRQHAAGGTAFDILVFADSDMRVGPDYLATVTAPLSDLAIGLVTCPLQRAADKEEAYGRGWAPCTSISGFLPNAPLGEADGRRRHCFGATIALRRAVLERIGNLAVVRRRACRRVTGSALRLFARRRLRDHAITLPCRDLDLGEKRFTTCLWRH